jgi:hypothetical protein
MVIAQAVSAGYFIYPYPAIPADTVSTTTAFKIISIQLTASASIRFLP